VKPPANSTVESVGRHVDLIQHLLNQGWDDILRHVADPEFNSESLWSFLQTHRLQNFVAPLVRRPGLRKALPVRLRRRIVRRLGRAADRQEPLFAALANANAALHTVGVRSLLLKGFALANRFYPDPIERHQTDIDLLVSKEQLSLAVERLQSQGFALKRNRTTVRADRLRTEHAVGLTRDGVELDLHWRLRVAPAYAIDYRYVWASARQFEMRGESFETIADDVTLALLLLSVVHDLGRGAIRMKHIVDVHKILAHRETTMDWPAFWQDRAAENTISPIANGLALCALLLPDANHMAWAARALEAQPVPIRVRDQEHALSLLTQQPGSVAAAFWFAQVYRGWTLGNAAWLLRRNIPRPSRLPVACWRTARFLARAACWSATSFIQRLVERRSTMSDPNS
jgi:hypothetical protein